MADAPLLKGPGRRAGYGSNEFRRLSVFAFKNVTTDREARIVLRLNLIDSIMLNSIDPIVGVLLQEALE